MRQVSRIPAFQSWIEYLTAWLERRREDMDGRISVFRHLKIQDDPEALFQEGWLLCDVGDHDTGLEFVHRAIEKHYWLVDTLANSRQFDPLRSHPVFQALIAKAQQGRDQAHAMYRQAGGHQLLGV